jgi:hypothetical protein
MSPAAAILAWTLGLSGPLMLPADRVSADARQAVSDYRFAADTGLLVFHVHRDRTADFESVMAVVGQGLRAATVSPRREQAAGWRFFRSRETSEAAVYVVLVDPVVVQADYDPVKMLTEGSLADAPGLYERLRASVIRVERLDLERRH